MSHEQFEHDQAVELRAVKIENERFKTLVTELCDALEEEFGPIGYRAALKDKEPWKLIQRAREATR